MQYFLRGLKVFTLFAAQALVVPWGRGGREKGEEHACSKDNENKLASLFCVAWVEKE